MSPDTVFHTVPHDVVLKSYSHIAEESYWHKQLKIMFKMRYTTY